MKFGGGGKRGRAKIPSPHPPSFLPARAFSLAREARRQFRSKKVRISSNKRTNIKLSDFCPTDSAARSAKRYGNTGSPRTARLAKRRFEPKISLAATFLFKRLLSLAILTGFVATDRYPKFKTHFQKLFSVKTSSSCYFLLEILNTLYILVFLEI